MKKLEIDMDNNYSFPNQNFSNAEKYFPDGNKEDA